MKKLFVLTLLTLLFACGKKTTTTTEKCLQNHHYNGYTCIKTVSTGSQTKKLSGEKTIIEKCLHLIKEKNNRYELCVEDFIEFNRQEKAIKAEFKQGL